MRLVGLFIILTGCQFMMAQPIHVSILGRKTYSSYPDQYLFDVNYPGSDFQQQGLKSLIKVLDSLHVNYSMDSTKISILDSYIQRTYEISTNTRDALDLIVNYAENLDLIGNISYRYLPTSHKKQDSLAILAFHDALRRAQIMADHLGKKISKIINVDDQVEQYLFYFDYKMISKSEIDNANCFLKLIALLTGGNTPITDRERKGQYALWVTFELN